MPANSLNKNSPLYAGFLMPDVQIKKSPPGEGGRKGHQASKPDNCTIACAFLQSGGTLACHASQ